MAAMTHRSSLESSFESSFGFFGFFYFPCLLAEGTG
jgi:hypothetical protein